MGDNWITDMTHFLDRDGTLPAGANRRLVNHLGSIVTALTVAPAAEPRQLPISCRRRPNRKACPGKIIAGFEQGGTNILWSCPACSDQRVISRWQDTIWDKGGRTALPRINGITYRFGFLHDMDIEDDSGLESVDLAGSAITQAIRRSILYNQILSAAGVYGDPTTGDPLQIDKIVTDHPRGVTRITLYNRAIMLFTSSDELYVQIHRLCGMLTTHKN